MPKSPPARSPLCTCRCTTDGNSYFDGGIIHCKFHETAANLLPEMVKALQKEHDKLVDANMHFIKIDQKCAVCLLLSRAKEALGGR